MARRPPEPPQPLRPNLTVNQKRRCADRLEKRIQELEAFDPQTVQKRFVNPNVRAFGGSHASTKPVGRVWT